MNLVQLVYTSEAQTDITVEDIAEIVEVARERNAGVGITGYLAYARSNFLQVLEGSRAAVSELYADIGKDPRHRKLLLMHLDDIPERMFPEWSMGYAAGTKQLSRIYLRFGLTAEYEPRMMSAESAIRFLHALSRETSVDI